MLLDLLCSIQETNESGAVVKMGVKLRYAVLDAALKVSRFDYEME